MKGQWTGRYSGTNTGIAVVEIDDIGGQYEGNAFMFDDNPALLSTSAYICTSDKKPNIKLTAPLNPIDPTNHFVALHPSHIQSLRANFTNVIFPTKADVKMRRSKGFLEAEWITDIGTTGSMRLPKSRAGEKSVYVPEPVNKWSEFETYVRNLEHYNYMYRGQERPWRLRTAFHRTGRAALLTYMNGDIPTLHRNLSSRTRHFFNLSLPIENGAFYNLVQHHGYPTPLLDWTYSPYVAAFFAYHVTKQCASKAKVTDKVRVFIFNEKAWCKKFNQLQILAVAKPHFSILKALAIENERLIPQQALSSISNIDDIESYINDKEIEANDKYLRVIDLPWGERELVMRELARMGITAGSLFPGLDGACEELKDRFFSF
jgi:FRG domain